VIETDEPTSTSNTPSVATCYLYDALGNLSEVDQGSETRKYAYDMLSRLTSAQTPEAKNNTRRFYYTTSGGALCSGDPSALCRRTDENGITTTYTYDALNRPTGMTYSNGDRSLSYSYDQTSYNGLTIANGKGQRTGMNDGSGKTAWSFDTMGRVAQEERTIGTVTKTLAYGYNLDGSLASVTYPSGRTVKYTPSPVGRPLSAVDTGNSINYVTSATYAPQGALATAAYGANITFSAGYNNRLWPNDLKGKTSSTFFELQSSYYSNGNVHLVTNTVTSARSETFGYDYLNRITSAQSGVTSGQYCWSQSFSYDRYGNLTSMNNTGSGSGCWSLYSPNLSVNTYNQISAFSYDASGNTTADGAYSYAWNGEGLQKSAGTTNYTYDGDSKRVEKSTGTYYWFSPDGLPLAETDSSGNTQNEYIYFSGRHAARRDSSGNVYYCFLDQIGTSHLIANASGAVCYDADYTPFGQELAYTTSCAQKYKFTGLELDSETGNDHAWFRNYGWNVGRWLSPDTVGGDVTNPQSLDRYTYALDNPTTLTDPVGLDSAFTIDYGCSDTISQLTNAVCRHGGGGNTGYLGEYLNGFGPPPDIPPGAADAYESYLEDVCFGCIPINTVFYGRHRVNWTFDSLEQYADFRLSLAILPQNQIDEAFGDLLENEGLNPNTNYQVEVVWWGLIPNVSINRPLNKANAASGAVGDIYKGTHPKGSYVKLWPPVDSAHLVAQQWGLYGWAHNDSFNGILLFPLHFLFDFLPSFFINRQNPKAVAPNNPTFSNCSGYGGCSQ